MAWQMTGQMIEACSCKMLCPCYFGPAEPDQGWCSGALPFEIQQGASDGVNLSGCTVVWLIDLPKDFASGNGTACLYIDAAATADQRRELEAIFTGKKGGPWAMISTLVTTWLPTQTAPITITWGEQPTVTVGTVGHVHLQRMRDEAGRATQVHHASALGAFQVASADLARSDGTHFAAPQMRQWASGGSGSVSAFSWSV